MTAKTKVNSNETVIAMTANLYEKNGKYHVMLSWRQDGVRKQKSVKTGLSVHGNNKRMAESARVEILREWEDKITENYCDNLFSDYLKEWLEIIRHSIAETTYFSYKQIIENTICPYFAERKIKLHDLKPYHIQDFYQQKLNGGVTANTIHHYHANIRKALRNAVELERIPSNPALKVSLPKKKKFIADFYTADEMKKLMEYVKGSSIEIPVYLTIWFGLRRGEVLGLKWSDINFEVKSVLIRGVITDKGGSTRLENIKYRDSTKTEASVRMLPLPDEVAEYLRKLKAEQDENRIIAGNAYNTDWLDFICVNQIGEIIKPEFLSRKFPILLKNAGLRKIRFHELRDSNASLLVAQGVDMKRIQLWMGHSNYKTTADIYAHLRVDANLTLGDVLSKQLA